MPNSRITLEHRFEALAGAAGFVSKRRQVFEVAGDVTLVDWAEVEEAVAWGLKQVPAAPESIFENASERPRSASPHSASSVAR